MDLYHGTSVHVSTAKTAVSSWRAKHLCLSLCSENCKKTIKRLMRMDAEDGEGQIVDIFISAFNANYIVLNVSHVVDRSSQWTCFVVAI